MSVSSRFIKLLWRDFVESSREYTELSEAINRHRSEAREVRQRLKRLWELLPEEKRNAIQNDLPDFRGIP